MRERAASRAHYLMLCLQVHTRHSEIHASENWFGGCEGGMYYSMH